MKQTGFNPPHYGPAALPPPLSTAAAGLRERSSAAAQQRSSAAAQQRSSAAAQQRSSAAQAGPLRPVHQGTTWMGWRISESRGNVVTPVGQVGTQSRAWSRPCPRVLSHVVRADHRIGVLLSREVVAGHPPGALSRASVGLTGPSGRIPLLLVLAFARYGDHSLSFRSSRRRRSYVSTATTEIRSCRGKGGPVRSNHVSLASDLSSQHPSKPLS
jgi:hypothetical protein